MPDDLHSRLISSLQARLETARAAEASSDTTWDTGVADESATPEDAEFIAANDPATEIRRVEALLRVVRECVETLAKEDAWDPQLDGGTGEEFDLARFALKVIAAGEGIEVGDG